MKRTMGMGLALSAALGLGTLAFSSALAQPEPGSINNSGILLQHGGFNGSNFNATIGGQFAQGYEGGSYLTNTNVNQTANNSTAAVVGSGNSLNLNVNKACGICVKGIGRN
jgi:hypothetical protein